MKSDMKINTRLSLFFVCLYLLQPYLTNTAYYNGYNMIRDLDTDSRFASDAGSWTISGGTTGTYTTAYQYCSTTLLLGGYCVLGCSGCSQIGDYFQRVYTDLPPHNSIRFVLTFWAIDSWDLAQNNHDDGFQLYFDGTVLDGWHMSLSWFPTQLCGNTASGWNELPMRIFGTIPHTASSITFRVVADLNEDSCNESFGFRDISFIFDQQTSTGTNLCAITGISQTDRVCKCSEGYYLSGSTCVKCDSNCASCFGPSASECYACANNVAITYDGTKCVPCYSTCATCFGGASIQCLTCVSGYYYIPYTRECVLYCPWPLVTSGTTCTSPCDIDQYVMFDGTSCLSSCPSPYVAITEHTVVKLCLNPCTGVEYLYWDGSCQHDCGTPLTITKSYNNTLVCNYGCTGSQYLYPDGTCSSTCDSPFISRVQSNRYICQVPCMTGYYLYWDGTCDDSCSGYLTTSVTKGITYCNYPCLTSEYLFWNGSCKATCPYPLQTRVERSRLYCDYPTATGNYLYWDGTSASTCSETWLSARVEGTSITRKFCDLTCSSYSYVYWNGSCFEDCPYPLQVTVTNNVKYCGYSCTGSNYLYWNGSCLSSCDSPLVKKTEGGKFFCDYPCLTAQYLYWDGSCSFKCDGYLETRSEGDSMKRQFCDFPCESTEYLNWDGTCKSSCLDPWVSSTKQDRKYCNFKCSRGQYLYYNGSCLDKCDATFDAQEVSSVEKYCNLLSSSMTDCSSSFYYWNDTCHDDCAAPLVQRTVGTQKWCLYPCLANQFLYPDSRCLDTCDLPFTVREELGSKFCDYPCDLTSYAYWNGSCLSTCIEPYRSQTTRYGLSCLLPCDSTDLFYHEKTKQCTANCSAPGISENEAYAVCLASTPETVSDGSFLDVLMQGPSEPGTPSFMAVFKMLQYIRFLDIDMPIRLKNMIMSRGRSIVSLRFGQYMPDDMILTYSNHSIPNVFKDHNMHSEFIVNFWSELTSWTMIALVILILAIFEGICALRNWKSGENVFNKLKVLTRWNLPLIMLATSTDDILFYTILEIISLGKTSAISIELCLVMLGLLIALIAAIFYLVPLFAIGKRKIILHKKSDDRDEFLNAWGNCQVLYRGFRDHINPNGYFFLLHIFRIAFPMLIASTLFMIPTVQASIYVLFSLLILGFILYKKPVNRKINHIQLIIVESIILIINIALLILCILNLTNSQGSSIFVTMGDIVVYGNLLLNFIVLSFLIIKLVDGAVAIQKYPDGGKDKSIWLQLLVFYMQQAGMSFEEIFIDSKAAEIFNNYKYVLEHENVVIDSERKRLLGAKKSGLLDQDDQSLPILKKSSNDRRNTFLKRSAPKVEEQEIEVEEEQKSPILQIKPQKIEMDGRDKLLNETNFIGQNREKIRDVVSFKFNS